MKISTRGRYALRVMLDLAEHEQEGCVSLRDIAARQNISEKYLEAIAAILVRAGCVAGTRGKGGGYRLLLAPEECTVGQVLKLTEGSLAPVACLDHALNTCNRAESCRTLPMWQELARRVDEYLESITLADLLAGSVGEKSEE